MSAGDFSWDDFCTRWFAAVDARDSQVLEDLCRIDVKSQRVGCGRLQRSNAGLLQDFEDLWAETRGGFVHDWRIVSVAGDYAVVEWTRISRDASGIETRVVGVSFMRTRAGLLDLYRAYET